MTYWIYYLPRFNYWNFISFYITLSDGFFLYLTKLCFVGNWLSCFFSDAIYWNFYRFIEWSYLLSYLLSLLFSNDVWTILGNLQDFICQFCIKTKIHPYNSPYVSIRNDKILWIVWNFTKGLSSSKLFKSWANFLRAL